MDIIKKAGGGGGVMELELLWNNILCQLFATPDVVNKFNLKYKYYYVKK